MVHLLTLAAVTAPEASPEALAQAGSGLTIILLMVVGIGLIFLETMIPGGFIGAIGGVCILFAVVTALLEHSGQTALLVLAVGIVASMIAIILGWRQLPRSRFSQWIFLTPSPGRDFGAITGEQRAKAAVKAGDRGLALTDLHPAGAARVGEHRLDVVTRGEYIESGTPVEVVAIDGTRVVVRTSRQPDA